MHPSHIDYNAYAFSGPRRLTQKQQARIDEFLDQFPWSEFKKPCLVGDAPGLDWIIRNSITWNQRIFEVKGNKPVDFARRTLTMIYELSLYEKPCLYAFVNRSCPLCCKPSKNPKGGGSGTWLAVAAARYREIPIKIVKLEEFELPDWLSYSQLSLF